MAAPRKRRYDQVPQVTQPPVRVLFRPGDWIDVTGMDDDALYEALAVTDAEVWDTARFAAECKRSVTRTRKWVANFYDTLDSAARAALDLDDTETDTEGEDVEAFVPDDKIAPAPDGYAGRSPWWYAYRARAWAMGEGLMTRNGTGIPFKPTGRRAGGAGGANGQQSVPTMRDVAPKILARHRELLAGGMNDVDARGQLAEEFGMNRRHIARRLTMAEQMEAKAAGREIGVDNAALLEHYRGLIAGGTSDDEARDLMVAQLGITRRSLATRLTVAETAEQPAEQSAAA